MRGSSRYLVCAVFLILTIGASSSHAAWVENGAVVCAATNTQETPLVVSDAAGGAIVAWRDYRNGNFDIYAQRLDANGNALWTTDGVAVCTNTNVQSNLQIVADGAGGAVIVWQDNRNGTYDIYAQRVNSTGSMAWTANGIAVIVATGDQTLPHIAMTGVGTGIIAWQGNGGGTFDIRAQRFASDGDLLWATSGVAICTATGDQVNLQMLPDGSAGAVILWEDGRGSSVDIYAQRVNSSGVVQWAANGVPVCTAGGSQADIGLVASSNAVIAVWRDARTDSDVYAQRISSTGNMLWTADGVPVCTGSGERYHPKIVSDGSGGGIIAWVEFEGANNWINAQRVQSNGTAMWTANGVNVASGIGDMTAIQGHDPFDLVSMGDGQTIFTWWTPYEDADSHSYIHAQRISPEGDAVWTDPKVTISAASPSAVDKYPQIASDGTGQFIIAWMDNRSGVNDIYAQMLGPNGYWGNQTISFSVADVRGDQGAWVRLHTLRTLHDRIADPLPITGYCVWRKRTTTALSLEGGNGGTDAASSAREALAGILANPARAGGKSISKAEAAALAFPAGSWEALGFYPAMQQSSYDFIVPTKNDSSGAGIPRETFLISAHTPSPSNYILSAPDSGYSVDNLAPGLVHGLAGQQKYVPAGLKLSWHPNIEADLAHYAVYRGTSAGFVPGAGNLIASPGDTTLLDSGWRWSGGYYYKVSAIDRHGNESGFAILTPDAVTGTDTPKAPIASYLAQNYPNPFNPMTRITFGLKEPATVSLRIYDAAGRLVRVLVAGSRPAGTYSELWDGRDSGGRAVASGIYFYRLDAGSFSRTRKMVLLR